MSLNPKQFRQQRLFNPLSVPRKQPHQMGLDEFASRPRTWWHSSNEADFENVRQANFEGRHLRPAVRVNDWGDPDDDDGDVLADPGFHVGTLKSAYDRTQHRDQGDSKAFLHPVRFAPHLRMENTPRRPIPDRNESWDEEDHNHFYRNEFEDVGSTSAILESPSDVDTYADHVAEAARDPKRILGGEAQHRLDTGQMSFPASKVDIRDTGEVAEKVRRIEYGEETWTDVTRHEITYRDGRETPSGRAAKAWGYDEGVQGFMFEGPGTRAPKVRSDLIQRDQFK